MKILKFLTKNLLMIRLVLFFSLIITSCSGDDSNVIIENTAGFEYSLAEDGSTVNFTNTSVNASSYEWYFGDGTTSLEKNPSKLGQFSMVCQNLITTWSQMTPIHYIMVSFYAKKHE